MLLNFHSPHPGWTSVSPLVFQSPCHGSLSQFFLHHQYLSGFMTTPSQSINPKANLGGIFLEICPLPSISHLSVTCFLVARDLYSSASKLHPLWLKSSFPVLCCLSCTVYLGEDLPHRLDLQKQLILFTDKFAWVWAVPGKCHVDFHSKLFIIQLYPHLLIAFFPSDCFLKPG